MIKTIIILLTFVISGCKWKYAEPKKGERICHKLVAKQSQVVSGNRVNRIQTEYYFYYDNGQLEEVDLEIYMEFKEGEQVCWTQY